MKTTSSLGFTMPCPEGGEDADEDEEQENEEVVFMPTHTAANPCEGKVFTIEMHHTRHETAKPGDNVGLNIKGLVKQNMPRVGDVMIYKKDKSLNQVGQF